MVVVHRASWGDLNSREMPALSRLIRIGAVGLMNAPQGARSGLDPAGPFLTIGAGRPIAEPNGRLRRDVRAPQVVRVRGLGVVRRATDLGGAVPGLLGQELREVGLDVAANAGSLYPSANAAAIGMDSLGLIRGPLITKYGECIEFHGLLREPDLLIMEELWLPSLDDHLGYQSAQLDFSRDLLIILAPTTPPYREKDRRVMAPIVIVGRGFRPGLLTSASSRMDGIVSNTDIAPTILRFFGLAVPDAMSGHPIRVAPSRDPLAAVRRLDRATSVKYALVRPLVSLQCLWLAMAIAVGSAGLALRRGSRARGPIGAVVLLALALSIGLLLQPIAPFERPIPTGIVAVGWAAFAVWAASRARSAPVRVGVLCAAIAAELLAATLTRSQLLWRSALGLELIVGSRFYGIGNEWMTILVAAAAIAGGVAADLWPRRLSWHILLWLGVVLALGQPMWGANWGGCLTAAIAGVILVVALASRPRWFVALVAVLAALGAVGSVLMTNLTAPDQTHIAQSAHLVARQGLGAAAGLAGHRLASVVAPLGPAPLLVVPAGLMLAALVTAIRPWGPFKPVLGAYPGFRAGLLAACLGGFAAAALNDSGVVLLGAASTVVLPSLLYVALERL